MKALKSEFVNTQEMKEKNKEKTSTRNTKKQPR
jgi:hypothetical protein